MTKTAALRRLIGRYHRLLTNRYRGFFELSEREICAQFIRPLFTDVFGWPEDSLQESHSWQRTREKGYVYGLNEVYLTIALNEKEELIVYIPPGNPSRWDIYRGRAQTHSLRAGGMVLLSNFDTLCFFYRGEQILALSVEQYEQWLRILLEHLDYRKAFGRSLDFRGSIPFQQERQELMVQTYHLFNQVWEVLRADPILIEGSQGVEGRDRNAVQLLFCLMFYRLAEETTALRGRDQLRQLLFLYRQQPDVMRNSSDRWKGSLYQSLEAMFLDYGTKYGGDLFKPSFPVPVSDETLAIVIEQVYKIRHSPDQIPYLGQYYEQILAILDQEQHSKGEGKGVRKRRGSFYTPPYLTEYLIQETLIPQLERVKHNLTQAVQQQDEQLLEQANDQLTRVSIIDPACGTGAFLVIALQHLLQFYRGECKQWVDRFLSSAPHLSQPVMEQLEQLFKDECLVPLTNQIHGVDLDPMAIAICQQSLILQFYADCQFTPTDPIASQLHVKQGNALFCPPPNGEDGSIYVQEGIFSWQHHFPSVFNNGGFTLVVGNPPWGGEIGPLKQLITNRYSPSCQAPFDSYKLFTQLGMELLTAGGRLGFVLPSTLLNQVGYEDLRGNLLKGGRLVSLVNLGEGVFEGVTTPCCLLVWEKKGKGGRIRALDLGSVDNHNERQSRLERAGSSWHTIEQDNYVSSPYHSFNLDFDERVEDVLAHIYRQGPVPLGEVVHTITRGVETGNNRVFLAGQEEVVQSGINLNNLPLCFGGEQITPYFTYPPDQYLIIVPEEDGQSKDSVLTWLDDRNQYYTHLAKTGKIKKYVPLAERHKVKKGLLRWYQLNSPRLELTGQSQIVLRQTSDRLIAALNPKWGTNLSNVQNIVLKEGTVFDPHYLVGVFNSTLINFCYQHLVQERGRTFAEVKRENLEKMPLHPATEREQGDLSFLVKLLAEKKKQIYTFPSPDQLLEGLELGKFGTVWRQVCKSLSWNDELLAGFHELQSLLCLVEGEQMILNARLKYRDPVNPRLFLGQQPKEPLYLGKGLVEEPWSTMLFVYLERVKTFPTGYRRTVLQKLDNLLVPVPSGENAEIISTYLKNLGQLTDMNNEVSRLERCVDRYVYALYGLEENQVRLVEQTYWKERYGQMYSLLPSIEEVKQLTGL